MKWMKKLCGRRGRSDRLPWGGNRREEAIREDGSQGLLGPSELSGPCVVPLRVWVDAPVSGNGLVGLVGDRRPDPVSPQWTGCLPRPPSDATWPSRDAGRGSNRPMLPPKRRASQYPGAKPLPPLASPFAVSRDLPGPPSQSPGAAGPRSPRRSRWAVSRARRTGWPRDPPRGHQSVGACHSTASTTNACSHRVRTSAAHSAAIGSRACTRMTIAPGVAGRGTSRTFRR